MSSCMQKFPTAVFALVFLLFDLLPEFTTSQPFYPAFPIGTQQGYWPQFPQGQSAPFLPPNPNGMFLARNRMALGVGPYGYPFNPEYALPSSANNGGRSGFVQGIENGFGQLFPRYPGGQIPAQPIGAFPRFIPGPNNYGGYGTNSWSSYGLNPGGPFAPQYATGQFLSESLFDRENFQARGCGWDQARGVCSDLLGICKGGCQDFSFNRDSLLHDCRCVPVGYSALLMGGRNKNRK